MKKSVTILLLGAALQAFAIPQLINYQGQLTRPDGTPLDSTVAMTFNIWTAPAGGLSEWIEAHPAVVVTDGLFSVQLGSVNPLPDLYAVNRWLGVTIGGDTEMMPREQMVSVAHAYRVGTVDGASGGTITSKINIGPGNTNAGTNACVLGTSNTAAGNYSQVSGGRQNRADTTYSTVGGGYDNTATGVYALVGGGASNVASNQYAVVVGGLSNDATGSRSFVGGGNVNYAAGSFAVIGGGDNNDATANWSTVGGGVSNEALGSYSFVGGGAYNHARGLGAVIAGGGTSALADSNSASGNGSSIGGGRGNVASGQCSVVGGGILNAAAGLAGAIAGGQNNSAGDTAFVGGGYSNDASADYAVIGGGYNNTASGLASVVAGGTNNTADNTYATVGGGRGNTVSGYASTVPGGRDNVCNGDYTFVCGNNAHVGYSCDSAFVFSDGTYGGTITGGGSRRFVVIASNGTLIYTNGAATLGAQLPANATAWVAVCDSTRKERYGRVNTRAILENVSQIPIETWSYKEDPNHVRHIGPMAQDFYAAFHLGESDTTISTLDPDGVALAAIQELAKWNADLSRDNRELRSRVSDLEQWVNQLAQLGLNKSEDTQKELK